MNNGAYFLTPQGQCDPHSDVLFGDFTGDSSAVSDGTVNLITTIGDRIKFDAGFNDAQTRFSLAIQRGKNGKR